MSLSARLIFCFFLAIFTAFPLQAQQVRPFPMEEKALLWKATHPNKTGEIYLFGTMHLIEKDYFYFPKKLQKLIEGSDLVVMEIAGVPQPMEMLQLVTLEEGSLFDFFSAAQRDSILDWAERDFLMDSTIFCSTFGKMKPFVVAQMAIEMEFTGSTESYEMHIEKIAKDNGIPIKGLETAAEQMGYFDAIPLEEQRTMVMESIRGNSSSVSLKAMEEVYQGQDLDSLYMLIRESGGSWAALEDELLNNRNYNWLNQMPGFFTGEKVIIAVGAGHLGGPEGLIRLMEENGYRLSPVTL
jgi:hypothetical protein